jgi:hypothetical protein
MSKFGHAQIILLLADGFDEGAVSIVSIVLRQAGLLVNLAGLRANRVRGAHGLVIVPNTTLERVLESSSPILALILPGGTGHRARLRADPRVKTLLQRIITEKAVLVGLEDQVTRMIVELTETNRESLHIIKPQAGMYLEDFASTLVQQLVGVAER